MSNSLKCTDIQDLLGYQFTTVAFLEESLTHSTYSNEHPVIPHQSNERLEFLGDAVLNLLAAETLLRLFPEMSEGRMSQKRTKLISNKALGRLALDIDIGNYLRLGKGQASETGEVPNSILADCVEAIAGAIYLDGGMGAVQSAFRERFEDAANALTDHLDHKSALQQTCHRLGLAPPRYEIIEQRGFSHDPEFVCVVMVGELHRARALGRSKSQSQQAAAEKILDILK
ncbi:MAG: ribonuclease III [Myxococcota bacterium]|nr:ribonuclease III [Myxococcota bacterium]